MLAFDFFKKKTKLEPINVQIKIKLMEIIDIIIGVILSPTFL